jgi:outer membrane immunogenic protein
LNFTLSRSSTIVAKSLGIGEMTRFGLLASVGLGALLVATGGASAQSAFDWNGFYVGGSIGAGGLRNEALLNDNYSYSYDAGLLTAMATAGFNVQQDSLVYGIEADLGLVALGDISSDDADASFIALGMSPVATLRGRVGFAVDDLLIYGTAGLAVAHVDIDDDWGVGYSTEGFAVGGVIGAGVEMAVTDNMSLRAEGRLMGFSIDGDSDGYTNQLNSAVGLVGVNFHF